MYTLTNYRVEIQNTGNDEIEFFNVKAHDEIDAGMQVGHILITTRQAKVGDYRQIGIKEV